MPLSVRRRWALCCAVLLAGAGVLAVLGAAGELPALGGLFAREAQHADEASLSAAAARGDAALHGPRLQGRDRPGPAATHGPVDVQVLDAGGQPIAGLRVVADWTPKDAPQEQDKSQPTTAEALTDSLGRVHFDDLSYTGAASVSAHPRTQFAEPAAEGLASSSVQFFTTARASLSVVIGPSPTVVVPSGEAAPEAAEPDGVPVLGSLPLIQGRYRVVSSEAELPSEPLARALVRGPEVALTVRRGLPFRLDVRLGGDGRALPGARWQVLPRLEWAADAFGSGHVPVRPGADAVIQARVEAPRGTISRRDASWETVIHPQAQRLEALYPLRPALDLVVVFPPEVLPFREEAWAAEVTVAGLTLDQPECSWVGTGRLRVSGGSHCVTEEVTVGGTIAGRWQVSGRALIGPDPRATVVVEVQVEPVPPDAPSESPAVLEFSFRLGDSVPLIDHLAIFRRLNTIDVGAADGSPLALALESPPPAGALRVHALTPEGLPAPGALVRVGGRSQQADAEGVARFEGLEPGQVTLSLLGAGAATSAQTVVVSSTTRDVDLRAGRGGTLDVELSDAEGNAIPIGTVRVTQPSGLPWIDFKDGTQRLDPFTDARGRRTLEGVEAGQVVVHGSYGTREVEQTVDLAEGQRLTVRLVLPVNRPEPAAPPAR